MVQYTTFHFSTHGTVYVAATVLVIQSNAAVHPAEFGINSNQSQKSFDWRSLDTWWVRNRYPALVDAWRQASAHSFRDGGE